MADDDLIQERQAFEALDHEFQQVLEELESDPKLERFRKEYEKLHNGLKASHDNEMRLLEKTKQLNRNIGKNAKRVQEALNMTNHDRRTIEMLRQEAEKMYKMIELAKERDERNKTKMENLHQEIQQLQQVIEDSNTISSGQNNRVNELEVQINEITKENNMLDAKVKNLILQTDEQDDLQSKLNEQKLAISQGMAEIQQKKDELEKKCEGFELQKKQIQKDLEEFKTKHEATSKEQEEHVARLKTLKKKRMSQMKKTMDGEKNKDKSTSQMRELVNKLEEQARQLGDYKKTRDDLKDKTNAIMNQLDHEHKVKKDLEREKIRQERKIKSIAQDIIKLKQDKNGTEILRNLTKNSIYHLEQQVEASRRLGYDDLKIMEDLKRDRDLLDTDINKANSNNKKQDDLLVMRKEILLEKNNEVNSIKKNIDRKNKTINRLEKEKEKYGMTAAKANAKYFHSLEEIKLKDNLISEFQKKNLETEAKLKQQQTLYETVRHERNIYSKSLTETNEEINELRRRYKIVQHQISQLKEEIDQKEQLVVKEHVQFKKAQKKIEMQQQVSKKHDEEIEEKDNKIQDFLKEIADLKFMIQEIEMERNRLKENFDLKVNERNILGTQLIRRQQELHLLYEKIKIQKSRLKKGEIQYKEKLDQIAEKKSDIAKFMAELKMYTKEIEQIPDLKNEIHNLNKEYIEEKLKVKGLSEELENPMNVHRWRKLQCIDSENYELITKTQTLLKRLIAKTEEVKQKEVISTEKDSSLNELRISMKRQPSLEEARMITTFKDSLKQKEKQMNIMSQDLGVYQGQVNEYKTEIERMTNDLIQIKKKYLKQKKRERLRREKETGEMKALSFQINVRDKKFTGGGYNLAV